MRIFVAAATGRLGNPLIDHLIDRRHEVRALTRDPDSTAAMRLKEIGADVVTGDFDDPASLRSAMSGTQAAFVATTPHHGAGPVAEVRHAVTLADTAAATGVEFIVYGSAAGAARPGSLPMLSSKAEVERHLSSLGVPHAVVAPVFFLENLFFPWNVAALRRGLWPLPLPRDVGVEVVSVTEVAAVAAEVLVQPDVFAGERIDVASDLLTGERAADVLSGVSRRKIRDDPTVPAELAGMMPLFDWLSAATERVDIPALQHRFPHLLWDRFDQWAARQNWDALLRDY